MEKPTGSVTFLFTDIEGSTKLSQEHPETLPLALERHHSILQTAIELNNGFVFEIVGDAFCCAFEKAKDAVKAAVDIQLKLADEKWKDAVIKVRIGIHSGNAEWNGNKYMGYITLARTSRVMSATYGEQIIISNNTYELCKYEFNAAKEKNISFRDLGERRLKDVIQPIRLFQVISPELKEDFPPLKTLDARPNNLPVQLTSFIGREEVMKNAKRIFLQTRLLTILGSGGAGKTRLSLQLGAEMIDDFSNGVFITELASVQDPTLLVQTVMNYLKIKEEPGRSLDQALTEYLKDKEILLILDNCEHLIRACADLTEKLLSQCPNLKIIATSREALNCSGEYTYKLPSMSLPDTTLNNTAEQLTQYEAVRLFIERALSVNSNFRVDNSNAPALAGICSRLDGIPLAIELAAARIKVLSLENIHKRLDDRFNLLSSGIRTALPRQKTLRALIDWSYDLLTDKEKTLWNRLSVFNNGWTLESAEEICSDDKISKSDILDLLSQLAEKSIISYDETKDRYKILETIKQYGEEKLKVSGETYKIMSKHLEYFTMFAETAGPKVEQSDAVLWLEKLENDHGNFQTSIQWSVRNGDKEKGARIANALGRFWIIRGYYSIGKLQLENILENQEGISQSIIALVNSSLGNLAILQGEFEVSRNFFERGLLLSRETKDKFGIATSLNGLGTLFFYIGNFEQAQKVYLESLEINREIGNKRGIAMTLNNLGNVTLNLGKHDEAIKFYEESIIFFRESGSNSLIALPLHNLGLIADNQGNYEDAKKIYEESLSINRDKGDKRGIANTLLNLGLVEHNMQNNEKAIKLFEECRMLYNEIGDKAGLAFSLYGFGIVLSDEGKYEQAQNFLEESLTLRQAMGDKSGIVNCLNHLGIVSFNKENNIQSREYIEQSLECNKELGDEWGIDVSIVVLAGIASSEKNYMTAVKLIAAADSNLKFIDRVLENGVRKFQEQIRKKLYENLSDEEFSRYYEEGKNLTLLEATELVRRET